MAGLRAAALKALVLLMVPGATFWACVTLASSVMLGIAALAAWFGALVLLPSLRLQNASLTLLSLVLAWAAFELVMRTSLFSYIVGGRDFVEMQAGRVITEEPWHSMADDKLGFRLAPNQRARGTLTKNGRPVYDVIYTMDANGFRKLPPGPVGGTRVLLLGDSFNFGIGINDDQTLGFYLRDLSAGRLQPFTLATPGMGIHQVLRQLEIGEPTKSGHTKFAWALVSIVDDHVLRASGHSYWLRESPRYEVEADGRLVLRGNYLAPSKFLEQLFIGSRLVSLAWGALTRDTEGDRRRFVAVLRAVQDKLSSRYGAKLLVLYHSGQTWRGDLTGSREEMVPLLCQAGVPFLDVSALVRSSPEPVDHFYMAGDGHPTAHLNRLLAATIIAAMADGLPPSACKR